MLSKAIDIYHSLLTDEIAQEADFLMRKRLLDKSLYFGDRPLCVVLRPHFYFDNHWTFVKNALDILLGAFHVLHEACLKDANLRAQLRLDDYEEALIPYDKQHIPAWTSSRLDTFFVVEEGILKCVEYNAETPAGIGYADTLTEVFLTLEPMKQFQKHYKVHTLPALGKLTDALINAYKAWGGTNKPQIAILDWAEVPTLNEHEITRQYFAHEGFTAKLADPRGLEYRNGKLWSGDFRIDMIYKRVLYSELTERMGLDNPVYRALRDGNVFITNSISAKMMAKKASLAMLSDERNTHLFNARQQAAINEHIPWTRVVEERKTLYQGKTIDLVTFLQENRERFVLKPNDEYGGSGVMLGWECSDEVWQNALATALTRPFVAQEKVHIVERPFPMWLNGAIDISPRFVDADPYCFNGTSVEGCMTRVSSLSLLNVTAGGGSIVPTMILSSQ